MNSEELMKNLKKWQIVAIIIEVIVLVTVLVIAAKHLISRNAGKEPVASADAGNAEALPTDANGIQVSTDAEGNLINVIPDNGNGTPGKNQENGNGGQNGDSNEQNSQSGQSNQNGQRDDSQDDNQGNSADGTNGQNGNTGESEGQDSESHGSSDQGSDSTTEPESMQIDDGFEIEIPSGAGDAGM